MEHYLVAMAVTAGIYAILALGTNVIWGMAGLINLGLVGFFAAGAYTSALLTLKLGWPIWAGLLAAIAVTSMIGVMVALVTVNLRGDYLAIVTLGFAESMRIVMSNEIWLANGTDGLSGIPGPWRGSLDPHTFNLLFLGIVVGVVIVLFVLAERLAHSPFGRALRGVRDDEQVVQVAGKNVTMLKVKAFAFGTAALGLGGALYGHFTSLHRARPVRAAAHPVREARAACRRARQQQGRRPRGNRRRDFPGVDTLYHPVGTLHLGSAGCGLARNTDRGAASGDPALLQAGTYSRDHSATGLVANDAPRPSGDR